MENKTRKEMKFKKMKTHPICTTGNTYSLTCINFKRLKIIENRRKPGKID